MKLNKYIPGIPPYTTVLLFIVGLLCATVFSFECSASKAPASFSSTSLGHIHTINGSNEATVLTAAVTHKIVNGHFSRVNKLKLKVFVRSALGDVYNFAGIASAAKDAAPSLFNSVCNRPGYYLFLFRYTPF